MMKSTQTLICLLATAALAQMPAIPARAGQAPARLSAMDQLVDSFYDPNVSDSEFLSQAQVSTPQGLRNLLENLYKTSPSALFSQRGQLTYFDYTPPEYGVRHAINYYIPSTYRADGTAPLLVIMHGGGASTNTYESAREVSQMYMQDFIPFAEKNGVVLVGPSSSLGWSYVGRILVSHTIELATQELAIDPDRVYVWGHSMGAMGIDREAHWLASRVTAFMPNAGGMQDGFRIDPYLKTYFDTTFYQCNGAYDGFTAFNTWTREVQKRIAALEVQLGEQSGYDAVFEPRGHNPDMSTVISKLENDILKLRRNKYQSSIYPLMERLDAHNNRLGPNVDKYVINKYFWIEAPQLAHELPRKEFDQGSGENYVAFSAKVANNTYEIKLQDKRVLSLRVLISSKMVDLSKPITIRVNGHRSFHGMVSPDVARMLRIARSRHDRSYLFENEVDISTRRFSTFWRLKALLTRLFHSTRS